MTTQGWVYLAGVVVCWRFFAGFWHRWESGSYDYHPLQAVFMGGFASLFWPLLVPAGLVAAACIRWPDAAHHLFIHEPSRERRERRLLRVRAETERLERELSL